jgi:hypothetical protein
MKDIKTLQSDFLISPLRFYQVDATKPFISPIFCETWPPLAIRVFAPERIHFIEPLAAVRVDLKLNVIIENYIARPRESRFLYIREIPNQVHRVKPTIFYNNIDSIFVDIIPGFNQLDIAAGTPICDLEVIRKPCHVTV